MKVLTNIMRVLAMPITGNAIFYIAIIALFSISIISIRFGGSSRIRAMLEMFGDVYLLCAFVTLIPLKIRKWFKVIIFAFLFLTGLADMVCFQTMGVALCPNVLQTWFQTNVREALEAVGMRFDAPLLILPFILMILLPPAIFFVRKRKVSIPPIISSLLVVITLASAIYGINNKRYLYHTYTRVSEDDMEDFIDIETKTHEYLPVYRLMTSVKEINRLGEMRTRLLANAQTVQCDSCTFESPLIVLIIGESYNRHHSSLYGYDKPTAELQEKWAERGNLHTFKDVISSYNLTFKSFQNMLTFYNYDSTGKWYDYTLVPTLFRKAGYEVCLFSNQHTIVKRSAFTDYCEDVFMNDYDLSQYLYDKRNRECHSYDMQLLDDYKMLCDTATTKPQLLIFHFLGIHGDFKHRYPEQERVFYPDDYHRPDLTIEDKEILANYDNAIAYNDKVVNAIIEQFDDQNAIILYVPDHGELVFDGCNEFGRNLNHIKKHVLPQFDIPFWIYCTDEYTRLHEQICHQIKQSTNKPFMTDDLPHLLVYLAGIKCKEYRQERNIIESSFDVTRKRMICGECDYDKL